MKLTRIVAATVLAGGVALAGASTANAAIGPSWLHPGEVTAHPSSGGTWNYGFWDVEVRSYYTVSGCHGSSVRLNGTLHRSIDTASGATSIAEAYAVNTPGGDDQYYYRTC